ncbi:MAG TPA: hypothetical protein VFE44_05145 [Thermoanaerobaculia bacterium]|nr:hypothetical protein [Thermoanaerobaculia bacterium]
MRRTAARALSLLLLPVLFLTAAPPASADRGGGFFVAGQFPLGGALVSLVFADPGRYAGGYGYRGRHYDPRPFYYRSRHAFPQRGHQCSRYCFADRGYNYHHPSCRKLHSEFYGHGVHPASYWPADYPYPDWSAYGWREAPPRYGYERGYQGRDRGYYGRDRGYYGDRGYQGDRRYGRRDDYGDYNRRRGKQHRHHRGCEHDRYDRDWDRWGDDDDDDD